MLPNLFFNLFAALLALSVSGGVALHDSRFDKVFASIGAPSSTTAQRDFGQLVGHELHIHNQSVTSATNTDPGAKVRTHRKHTSLHHSRYKLAALTA